MNNSKLIIRVYGLFINKKKEVLISDEFELGVKMTKFPGGGLEFGEGPIDCLKREIREECNGQEIRNIRHFYTTGFFQEAFFFEDHQLISIYYLADFEEPNCFKISGIPFDFDPEQNGIQSFRWEKITELNIDELSFPIDKFVAEKLKTDYIENS